MREPVPWVGLLAILAMLTSRWWVPLLTDHHPRPPRPPRWVQPEGRCPLCGAGWSPAHECDRLEAGTITRLDPDRAWRGWFDDRPPPPAIGPRPWR
jgi:hypothetical protein